ncbi:effector-associated constant component EACC1 [Streptomyces sp. RGM 3693]|uniref:effector-associated constant component EACC1 n=1 Tax=Streptomyces sp. RGM 3693 TaxID=3413284 RepID=UPI003D29D592
MDAVIGIRGGDEIGELAALAGWLRAERELEGAIQLVRGDIAETELGSGLDVISVAVGSGGVGVALAQSLSAWLRTRRSDVKVTFTANGRRVEIDARRVKDPVGLITQVLSGDDVAEN